MFRVTLGARGFFFLLFAAKIERQSRDHHDRSFAPQFSPQTTGVKKPSSTQGTLGSEAPTKKKKNAGRREHWLFAQTKGGKMLHVAYRDWQENFMCLDLTNQLLPRH